MPPQPGQKGTKKKGGRDARHGPPSRNTTPSSIGAAPIASIENHETALLELRLKPYTGYRIEDLLDNKDNGAIPDSKSLDALLERLNKLSDTVEAKSHIVDKGMRKLAQLRKDRTEEVESERLANERNEAAKMGGKKSKKNARPLAHGAHAVPGQASAVQPPTAAASAAAVASSAAQVNLSANTSSSVTANERAVSHASGSSSLSPPAGMTTSPVAAVLPKGVEADEEEDEDDEDMDERQPEPAQSVRQIQYFGEDPATFPDPTNYEIQKVTPAMSDAQICKIASVASFPKRSLADFAPTEPPSDDFSVPKPTTQVQANTFAAYVDQHDRPFTEEDSSFLRERPDRFGPSVIPPRGTKHYKQIWAEEDGLVEMDEGSDAPNGVLSSVEARGDLADLDENGGETDLVSLGRPTINLLQLLRPDPRLPPAELNGDGMEGTSMDIVDDSQDLTSIIDPGTASRRDGPATPSAQYGSAPGTMGGNSFTVMGPGNQDLTSMFEHISLPPATAVFKADIQAFNKKTLAETHLSRYEKDMRMLKNFLHDMGPTKAMPNATTAPDYTAHKDDDNAARLRYLREDLKETAILNGARKQRIHDELQPYLAKQEYDIVANDLGNQVNDQCNKRTRTIGKGKNKKRPNASLSGNAGQAKPGLGDRAKNALTSFKAWETTIGPVLDKKGGYSVPRTGVAKEGEKEGEATSIFRPADMAPYIAAEREKYAEGPENDFEEDQR